jgi:tetratricopeptide (TPR) repeat protein
MKKTFLMFFFICSSVTMLSAQADELKSVFEEANRLYLEQKYDAAVSRYESVIKNGYESGEVYYNLGNAYFKAGKIQHAMLNYERAKRIMPNDEDVNFNIQLANVQLIDKVEPIPELFVYRWTDSLLTIFSMETMIWMIYGLFIAMLSSFSIFLFARTYESKRYSLMGGMIFSFLLVIGIANVLVQSYRESKSEFAIVMTDVANIKSAPDSKGNDLFVIHRGIKVQVLDSVNKWNKIRLADGKVGWIPDQEVEII